MEKFFPESYINASPEKKMGVDERAKRAVYEKYSGMLSSKITPECRIDKTDGVYDPESLLEDAKKLNISETDLQEMADWMYQEKVGLSEGGEMPSPDLYTDHELIEKIINNRMAGEVMTEIKRIAEASEIGGA